MIITMNNNVVPVLSLRLDLLDESLFELFLTLTVDLGAVIAHVLLGETLAAGTQLGCQACLVLSCFQECVVALLRTDIIAAAYLLCCVAGRRLDWPKVSACVQRVAVNINGHWHTQTHTSYNTQ